MNLNTEHQITLTTKQCAALLAAAKTVAEAYSGTNRKDGEGYIDLMSAIKQVAAGMGLSSEKNEQLLQFMDNGSNSNNSWENLF